MSKIGGRDRSDVLRLAMSRHQQPEKAGHASPRRPLPVCAEPPALLSDGMQMFAITLLVMLMWPTPEAVAPS